MVKNYKLALIVLLASCSMSNAMLRVTRLLSRPNRLNAPSRSCYSGFPRRTVSTRSKKLPKKNNRRVVALVVSNPHVLKKFNTERTFDLYSGRSRRKGFDSEAPETFKEYSDKNTTLSAVGERLVEEQIRKVVGDDAYENHRLIRPLGYLTFKLSDDETLNLKKNIPKIFNNNYFEEEVGFFNNKTTPLTEYDAKVGLFKNLNLDELYERRKEGNEDLNGIFKSDEKDKDS